MRRHCFRNFWLWVIFGFCVLFFSALFLYSLVAGYRLDESMTGDYPVFVWKNVPVTLLILAAALSLFGLLSKLRVSLKGFAAVCLFLTFACGCAWVLCVRMSPRWDQHFCQDMAELLLKREYQTLMKDSYLCAFPFQLGYVLYCALMKICFGENRNIVMALLNVCFLTLMNGVLIYETSEALRDSPQRRPVLMIVCAMLLTCLQPLMLCNFLYGSLPGISLSVCAMGFALRFCRQRGWGNAALSVLLLCLACLFKSNFQIVSVALFGCMFLKGISVREDRWQTLLFSAALLLPLGAQWVLKKIFEMIIGVQFGSPIPILAWLTMGLQEGGKMSGWHNGYTEPLDFIYHTPEQNSARVMSDLSLRLRELLSSPVECLAFFKRKLTSTWLETTFGALQINRGANMNFWNLPNWVINLFYGKRAKCIETVMDSWTQTLYFGFVIGCARCIGLRKREGETWLAPLMSALTVLGAILYHTLFETKSLYMFMYLPLMTPVAAWGLCSVYQWIQSSLGRSRNE